METSLCFLDPPFLGSQDRGLWLSRTFGCHLTFFWDSASCNESVNALWNVLSSSLTRFTCSSLSIRLNLDVQLTSVFCGVPGIQLEGLQVGQWVCWETKSTVGCRPTDDLGGTRGGEDSVCRQGVKSSSGSPTVVKSPGRIYWGFSSNVVDYRCVWSQFPIFKVSFPPSLILIFTDALELNHAICLHSLYIYLCQLCSVA